MFSILLHVKKLITQIVCSQPVATGRFASILCCLPSLLENKR